MFKGLCETNQFDDVYRKKHTINISLTLKNLQYGIFKETMGRTLSH
jgi:hypothetical protein